MNERMIFESVGEVDGFGLMIFSVRLYKDWLVI